MENYELKCELRRSGISTALAFTYIGEALRNPGTTIKIQDNSVENGNNFRINTQLFNIIQTICKQTNISLLFNKQNLSIKGFIRGYIYFPNLNKYIEINDTNLKDLTSHEK